MKRSEIIEGREYAVADVNESDELGNTLLRRARYLDDQGQKRVYSGSRDYRGHMKGGYLRFLVLDTDTGEPKIHWQTGKEIVTVVRPQAVKGTWEEQERVVELRIAGEKAAKARRDSDKAKAQRLVEDLHDMGLGTGYFDTSVVTSRHGSVEGVRLSLSTLEALLALAGEAYYDSEEE